MIGRSHFVSALAGAALLCGAATAAPAKAARCFTTDDGDYPCEFRMTGSDGSFEITARGKPTFSLVIDEPGVAFGYMNITGRSVALPGRYRRSSSEPGCWVNDATPTKICAR